MAKKKQYSNEELIEDVKRMAQITGREPPTKTKYTEYGQYAPRTVQLRFGGWNEAMKEVGFNPRDPIQESRDRPSTCPLCEDVEEGLDFTTGDTAKTNRDVIFFGTAMIWFTREMGKQNNLGGSQRRSRTSSLIISKYTDNKTLRKLLRGTIFQMFVTSFSENYNKTCSNRQKRVGSGYRTCPLPSRGS